MGCEDALGESTLLLPLRDLAQTAVRDQKIVAKLSFSEGTLLLVLYRTSAMDDWSWGRSWFI